MALGCCLSLAGAALHYVITPKAYRATTTLQIERRNSITFSNSQTPWMDGYWDLEYYPTQYRLLHSRGLAERVVRNLRLLEDPTLNPAARTSGAGAGEDDQAALGALAGTLLAGLDVVPVTNTQLVDVAFISSAPEFAARVANGFAEAFIEWGVETRSANAGRASGFLGTQIDGLKQEIADKESELQAYSKRSDIVALDASSNVVLQRLEGLNKDYVDALSERIRKESRYRELLAAPKDSIADSLGGGLVSQVRSDQLRLERDYATKLNTYKPEWPAMLELKAQIDKGRQNLAVIIDETVQKASEGARSDYQTALRREQALAEQLKQLKSEAMQLNSAAVEYNNIKLEISTRRALLDELLRKQSETEVTSRMQGTRESNVRVVDRALVPGAPFRPSLQKNLTFGLGIGLALGLAVLFLAEYLDRTVKTPEDMERLLGLPTLAVIPDISEGEGGYGYRGGYTYGYGGAAPPRQRRRWTDKKAPSEALPIELVPHTRPRLVVSEAYRALRTALLLSSADELRCIVITSSESGEGKTATSVNLAVVMAQLGRSILLIDGDLRKPRLHEIFKISNRLGLVSVLTGGAAAEQACCATEMSGLFVCPSGPAPPNPSELLASTRMHEFLRHARAHFDFIIIDTPPVLVVTDPTLIGSIADGVVLCLRAGKVLREEARACRDRLRLSEVKILGTVLNRYRESQGSYGRRYHPYIAYAEGAQAPKSGSAA